MHPCQSGTIDWVILKLDNAGKSHPIDLINFVDIRSFFVAPNGWRALPDPAERAVGAGLEAVLPAMDFVFNLEKAIHRRGRGGRKGNGFRRDAKQLAKTNAYGFPPMHPLGECLMLCKPLNSFASSASSAVKLSFLGSTKVRLNKLTIVVYGDNPQSQRNPLSLGFIQESCLREQICDAEGGRFINLYGNGMTENDFHRGKKVGRLVATFAWAGYYGSPAIGERQ